MFLSAFVMLQNVNAQNYKEVADVLGIDHRFGLGSTGGGVSFHDFDGDGWDDITLATEIGRPVYFYRNNNGYFERIGALVNNLCESKQILWIDYDNDGDKDLFITCLSDVNRLYQNDNMFFSDVTQEAGLPLDRLKTYGATWGDYDRDGYLDLYVTNKRTTSVPNINNLFRNSGDGTFEEVTLSSGSGDPGKIPFCASFIDINNDLDPEIYIAQDKKASNTLLKNLGNGSFQDISTISGADLTMEGMSVAIGDYDNNSFLDMYITNIPEGNKLLKNNGNETFSEVAVEAGVDYLGYAWGSNFLDFDHDGDLDLYVSGMQEGSDLIPSRLYTNNGSGIFTIDDLGFEGDTVISFSNAIGDIDNDGYPDIIVNNFKDYESMLWKNSGSDNFWIKLKLEGLQSNRDGIGSFIHIYYNAKKIIQYTASAIGFLSQNSAYSMIGLGNTQQIDSIKIQWPSDQVDWIKNIQSNQSLTIREGSTQIPPKLYLAGRRIICEGDSIPLETGFYDAYQWTDGRTTRKIYVKDSGDYYVQVTTEQGEIATSDTIFIKVVKNPNVTFITTPSDNNRFNGTIRAIATGGEAPYQYLWSVSGRDTSFVSGVGPGSHSVTVTDQNGCHTDQKVEVEMVTGLLEDDQIFSIFPNPLYERLFIQANDLLNNTRIGLRLWSDTGKMIDMSEIEINGRITSIPFQFQLLPPGLYFIQLSHNEKYTVHRLLIR